MSSENLNKPIHPGLHIKDEVIPKKLSIKRAAELLGVGRPALSNLLNGKAALSPEMAIRLEKTFGASREKLIQLQAVFDQYEMQTCKLDMSARPYVPNFLAIKARDVENWANGNIEARSLLSVLLRKLIHSTGKELIHVDFPGYDNSQRKGWDGEVESGIATPWIPIGVSGWEFGCNKNPQQKAEKDYSARVEGVSPKVRSEVNFVFVTPQNWHGKDKWAKEKEKLGEWKSVKAYDASDLEQWFEQSIPAQGWFAEQANLPHDGVTTLEACWQQWKSATEPELVPEFFDPSIENYKQKLKSWLQQDPSSQYTVTADSREEALSFLACMFNIKELEEYKDRAIVFCSISALKKLATTSSKFIPIVFTEDIEREMGGFFRKMHTIIVRPRNTVEHGPDIALDLLTQRDFEKALFAMGVESDCFDLLGCESGRSPTILRRRLSPIQAIKTPAWAKDTTNAKHLIPMMLVGAWHAQSQADCEILSLMASCPYEDIEKQITTLLAFEDCPVWSVGQFRGAVSKIDVLFSVHGAITQKDIEDFFFVAECVLSESDPALELPEDQRWAASVYGKTRNHSEAIRNGICETLVILSVHGNNLLRARLGIDIESKVEVLIHRLLTPLNWEKLLSQSSDLPHYAEAAPNTFLSLLEEDLQSTDPQVFALMKPAKNTLFGGCPRTGLLWALETLAWKPEQLLRVCSILANLSKNKVEDNWANKPEASLYSIFCSRLPQTSATLDQRKKVLEALVKTYPEVGWKICLDQFDVTSAMGNYNQRPKWRNDASGAGMSVPDKEYREFKLKAVDLVLNWSTHTKETLGDLVGNLQGLPIEEGDKVWDLIESWLKTKPSDRDKAELRERIRCFAFARRGRKKNLEKTVKDRAREAYEFLDPQDVVIRYQWLFATNWVEESADEMEDDDYDYRKRDEKIFKLRVNALQNIWKEKGFMGIKGLLQNSEAPSIVGQYLANSVLDRLDVEQFLAHCLEVEDVDICMKINELIRGFFFGLDLEIRKEILSEFGAKLPTLQTIRLFKCAPCERDTWQLLDSFDSEIVTQYWREVPAHWARLESSQLNELVDNFLEVGRPQAAFNAVHFDLEEIETTRLKRLLHDMATSTSEAIGVYKLEAHYISSALMILQERPGVTEEEMAGLEFTYIKALSRSKHGILNLEKRIAKFPKLFMHAIALGYVRNDGSEDPPEWSLDKSEHNNALRSAAYTLLDHMHRIPGTDDSGNIDPAALKKWINEVRSLCVQHGRAKIGDHLIGKLLANAPKDENGFWPCKAVVDALEEFRSPDIGHGFDIGVCNSRGAHWRGEGGNQERELAETYRNWSRKLSFEYSYVANLLEQIAMGYDREAEWNDTDATVERRLT